MWKRRSAYDEYDLNFIEESNKGVIHFLFAGEDIHHDLYEF